MQFAPGIIAAILSAKSSLMTRAGRDYIDVYNSQDELVDRITFKDGKASWGSMDEFSMPLSDTRNLIDSILYSLKEVK